MSVLPFEQPVLTGITPIVMPQEDESHVVEVGIGLAAAYLAYRWWVRPRLAEHRPRTPDEAREMTNLTIRAARVVWDRLARPAVAAAYSASAMGRIPYPVVERMAQAYASELGDYVDKSSVDALVEGFTAQISNGWGEGIAWMRASEGFGLDGRQMRSYLSGLMTQDKTTYSGEPIPPQVIKKVESAILTRADKLGMNESRKAVQMGKNMVWLAMAAQGDLPPGTMKKWVTAEDERVCTVCGPLDQVTIPLHQQFESAGQRFYAPVVHPNCRCNLEIVYPPLDVVKKDIAGDPYNRNRDGEFAVREERVSLRPLQQERVRLTPKQQERVVLTPRAKLEQRVSLKDNQRVTLKANERVSLLPIADVVQEVEQIADEAVAAEGKALKSWDEPVFIPAYMILRQNHPSWLNESPYDLEGRHITLDGSYGFTISKDKAGTNNEEYSTGFFHAVDDDAALATHVAVGRNRENRRQEEIAGGDVAVRSAISPSLYLDGMEEEYDFVRDSMAGLTQNQLYEAAKSALEGSKTALRYLPANDANFDERDMLLWLDNSDANTVAAQIFSAYHNEQVAMERGHLEPEDAEWSKVIEVIKDAAANGDKRGAFNYGGVGRTSIEKAYVYLFRASNWLGDKPANNLYLADSDLASASGVYRIDAVTFLNLPSGIASDLLSHGKNSKDVYDSIASVVVLDISPVGLNQGGMTDEGR